MATGYTSPVAEGTITSAKEFAELCVRNFGIAITMREEPMDAKLPEQFKVEDYHVRSLETAKEKLRHFMSLTQEERQASFSDAVAQEIEQCKKYLEEKSGTQARYEAMIEKINAWEITPDWINLKEFMLDQLKSSMECDCGGSYYGSRIETLGELTFEEWEWETTDSLQRSVAWAQKSLREATERVNERNRMLGTFRESLARLPE
jgi:hypothetical protein